MAACRSFTGSTEDTVPCHSRKETTTASATTARTIIASAAFRPRPAHRAIPTTPRKARIGRPSPNSRKRLAGMGNDVTR